MVLTVIVPVLLLPILGSPPPPSDPTPSLTGAWRIEEEIDTRADGSLASVGPENGYDGLIVYTEDGFMSATLMPRGRKWTAGTATAGEMRDTMENGTAYTGRYEVDPKTRSVTHIVVAGMDPADEGHRLTRTFVLDGDNLFLSATFSYRGETLHFKIKLRRVGEDRE